MAKTYGMVNPVEIDLHDELKALGSLASESKGAGQLLDVAEQIATGEFDTVLTPEDYKEQKKRSRDFSRKRTKVKTFGAQKAAGMEWFLRNFDASKLSKRKFNWGHFMEMEDDINRLVFMYRGRQVGDIAAHGSAVGEYSLRRQTLKSQGVHTPFRKAGELLVVPKRIQKKLDLIEKAIKNLEVVDPQKVPVPAGGYQGKGGGRASKQNLATFQMDQRQIQRSAAVSFTEDLTRRKATVLSSLKSLKDPTSTFIDAADKVAFKEGGPKYVTRSFEARTFADFGREDYVPKENVPVKKRAPAVSKPVSPSEASKIARFHKETGIQAEAVEAYMKKSGGFFPPHSGMHSPTKFGLLPGMQGKSKKDFGVPLSAMAQREGVPAATGVFGQAGKQAGVSQQAVSQAMYPNQPGFKPLPSAQKGMMQRIMQSMGGKGGAKMAIPMMILAGLFGGMGMGQGGQQNAA